MTAQILHTADDLFERVGVAVLLLQTTERVIKLCLKLALPSGGTVTLESFESDTKGTLGRLIAILRARVELDEQFDALLREFLEKRNALIHNVDAIPGWSLASAEGLAVANAFVGRVLAVNEVVLNAFLGLMRAWQVEAGLQVPISGEMESAFKEVDARYVPIVDRIFFAKE